MNDELREVLESLRAAGQVTLSELPRLDGADAETRAAVVALHTWAEQMREKLGAVPQVYDPEFEEETEEDHNLANRLLALEEAVSRGRHLEGPEDPEHILLDETLAESGGSSETLDLDGTAPVIDTRAGTAGTGSKALRSDTNPGLKLVGDPGDETEDAATGDFVPTLEFVKDNAAPVVRRGGRVRLGAVDYGYLAFAWAHLKAKAAGANVTKTGMMLPLLANGCLKAAAGGLGVNIGDGLKIDTNVLKAVWVADP